MNKGITKKCVRMNYDTFNELLEMILRQNDLQRRYDS